MKTLRSLVTAGLAALAAGTAAAQDFTQMDLSGWYNSQVQQQNAYMNNMQEQIIQQNMANPQIVAMYNQMVASGQFHGDLSTFAYNYAATGGFQNTRGYYDTSNNIVNNERRAWNEYQGSVENYRNAYGGYTGGFSENMQEAGRGLMGQSTYYGYSGSQQLPHTWGANTTNYHQGNYYYVDESGTYWMADPNNSGQWFRLQR